MDSDLKCVYSCKLDVIPPTSNSLYITTRSGRRFPNPKFASIIMKIADQLPKVKLDPAWYLLNIRIFTGSYTKTGKNFGRVKKLDSSNRIKSLEDEISKAIGIDDMFFKKVSIEKYNSDIDWTFIEIFKISDIPKDWVSDDEEVKMYASFNEKEKRWVLKQCEK